MAESASSLQNNIKARKEELKLKNRKLLPSPPTKIKTSIQKLKVSHKKFKLLAQKFQEIEKFDFQRIVMPAKTFNESICLKNNSSKSLKLDHILNKIFKRESNLSVQVQNAD